MKGLRQGKAWRSRNMKITFQNQSQDSFVFFLKGYRGNISLCQVGGNEKRDFKVPYLIGITGVSSAYSAHQLSPEDGGQHHVTV